MLWALKCKITFTIIRCLIRCIMRLPVKTLISDRILNTILINKLFVHCLLLIVNYKFKYSLLDGHDRNVKLKLLVIEAFNKHLWLLLLSPTHNSILSRLGLSHRLLRIIKTAIYGKYIRILMWPPSSLSMVWCWSAYQMEDLLDKKSFTLQFP